MKKKEKRLFIIFTVLGSIMFCDSVIMFLSNNYYTMLKDIVLGIALGCVAFVYLLSAKK